MKPVIAGLAALAVASPAAALPPLQPHAAPILLGVGGASAALVADIDTAVSAASDRKGMFLRDASSIALTPIRACAGRADPRACLRPSLGIAPRGEPTVPVHVAVLVQPARGGLARLTCIGAGTKPRNPARQSILVDPKKALSPDAAVNDKPLDAISWCIFDAMNEPLP